MTKIADSLQRKWETLVRTSQAFREFLDGPNWVFIGVILFIFTLVYLIGFWSWPTMTVAIFTAIYAFIASNQMRQEAQTHTANVRRDYEYNPRTDSYEFGLRNFGPGPALYLRVYATVVEEEGDKDEVVDRKVILEEDDPPMSLEEGEFEPITGEDFLTLDPEYDHQILKLYYSYISRNGVETPENQHKPRQKSHEKLAEDSSDPRSIKLEKLREHCTSEPEEVLEAK